MTDARHTMDSNIGGNSYKIIRRELDICRHLPEPGQTWVVADIAQKMGVPSAHVSNRFSHLEGVGIVRKVGRDNETRSTDRRWIWETTYDGYEKIQDIIEGDENALFPCGHNGFRNERDVDGLTCTICETVWPREEVRA